jgi:membrane protease YdiL (CAAX protease family)
MDKQRFLLLSPILVVLAGALVIRLVEPSLGVWAWVPWILFYWTGIAALVAWGGGRDAIHAWMRHPTGHWAWSALAVLLGLGGLSIFLSSWKLLLPWTIWLPWLLVAAINPFLEEWYWRGLLLDQAGNVPAGVGITGAALFFALNHLFGIGYTSIGCRNPIFIFQTFVLALLFGVIYKKTRSLRWAIVGHALADLLGMSVAVFLNLWVPPM